MSRTLRARLVVLTATVLLAACSDAPAPTVPTPNVPNPTVGQLPGPPTAKALTAVPDSTFRPRSEDYTTGHPDLPGMRVSQNTVIVGISPDATVGGLNAMLQRLGATIVGGIAGVSGGPGALLAIRLPTTTHAAMTTALATLRAAPEVLVAEADIVMSSAAVTAVGTTDVGWNWTSGAYAGDPNLGTWALAAIRAPQMWNLNPHVKADGTTVATGVLDVGYDLANEDLRAGSTFCGSGLRSDNHGNHVASIIGAEHGNGAGMDGTNPFARLFLGQTPGTNVAVVSTAGSGTWGLVEMLRICSQVRVVNVSLAYNWDPRSLPSVNSASRVRAETEGRIYDLALRTLGARQPLPIIVSAAGNDRGELAMYASPQNNAALRTANANALIIVVEADSAVDGSTTATYARARFSNISGHLSAPGQRVPGARVGASTYRYDNGTSFSAPYVTGIVSYLLALEPSLPAPTPTANAIRDVLVRTVNQGASRGGQRMVDGFAGALELDVLTGSDRVLRRLLDVDDGTADGNTRIDPFSGAPLLTSDVRADTTIDMSDFRRWRDLMSAVVFETSAVFDGAADHPKRDVNGDGRFDSVAQENMFPFADFNGDGQLSLSATAPMAGVLTARGPMTDLQVLQSRFSDSTYAAADLDLLTASGDVHLRTTGCVPAAGERLRVRVTRVSGGFVKEQILAPGDTQTVLTVPVLPIPAALTPYTVRTSRIDAAGTELVGRDTTVQVTLAGDVTSAGGCAQAAVTSVTVTPATLGMTIGTTRSFTAVARDANGAVITGRIVQWTSTNAAVALVITDVPTSGVTLVSALTAGTATIRARVSGVQGTATVTVGGVAGPRITSDPTVLITDSFFGTIAPFTFTATGGTAPYTWSLAQGSTFSSALLLSNAGVLSGACQSCVTGSNLQLLRGGNILREPVVTVIVRDANGLTGLAEIEVKYRRGF